MSYDMLISTSLFCYFTAGILGSLFARFAQKYFGPSALFSHGKSAISTALSMKQTPQSLYEHVCNLTVSKHFFWHFYAFGLVSSLLYIKAIDISNVTPVILAIQCFRRLIECFFLMPGAKGSQMHLIHYGIGITYYPILLLSFHTNTHKQHGLSLYGWIALFIVSSVLQGYCHWLLGSIRKGIQLKHPHRPINHPLFNLIHAPHYFFELIIYLSMAGMEGFHPLMLMNLIWIVSILGVSAESSAGWLCKKWGFKSHEEFCKYLMIPFLF